MEMNGLVEILEQAVPKCENEYLGEDGLLYCSVCNGKTQTKINFLGRDTIARCICYCRMHQKDREEEQRRKEDRDRARKVCFCESNMWKWTFENDRKDNEELSNAMVKYTENFEEFLKDGQGLLLAGNVGTGKTYFAACIANRLIDKGYKVLMTNFARLTNQIQSTFEGKQELIDDLNRYALLIIDDLGAERKSEYMQEMVFNIIDARYRSGLPLIITTNLTIEEIKKTDDLTCRRIYDRIIERCFPIEMNGRSRRRQVINERFFGVKEKLGL